MRGIVKQLSQLPESANVNIRALQRTCKQASLSRSTMRLLYSVVKVHIARIVICYAPNARSCDTPGASPFSKPRAPRGFLFRFSVLFCGLLLAVRLAFDSLDYITHSAVCQDEICLRLFPIWKQAAVHLTVWIIAHIRLSVKMKFSSPCFRFGNNRCSLDILDYSIRRPFCQP